MTRLQLPLVLRRWRLVAAVVGASALVGGGALIAAPSSPSPAQAFHPVTNLRVLDTRDGAGVPVGPGATLDVVIPGLPADANAVAINLTVVDGTEGSFLTLYPTGNSRPTTSSINWPSDAAVANSTTVNINSDHSVTTFNLKGSVNVVMDLIGYYAPSPIGGATGPSGPSGQAGAQGIPGDAGDDGQIGPRGGDGDDGAQGPQGDIGGQGPIGADGLQGVPGQNGATPGPAGSVYLYASNTGDEVVAHGSKLSFDTVGPSFGGVIVNGGSDFVVPTAGVYKVTFYVASNNDTQFSIQVSGVDPGGVPRVFGNDATLAYVGAAVLTIGPVDRTITLLNASSGAGGLGIAHLIATNGGTGPAANAWILIEQLNG